MFGLVFILGFFGLASTEPCSEFLEGKWYVTRELSPSLIGRRISVRFLAERVRWTEDRQYTWRDLDVASGISIQTGKKVRGLSPRVKFAPLVEGTLVAVDGRSFRVERYRADGRLMVTTFIEKAQWSAVTDAFGETQTRGLDERELILFTTLPY